MFGIDILIDENENEKKKYSRSSVRCLNKCTYIMSKNTFNEIKFSQFFVDSLNLPKTVKYSQWSNTQ